MIISLSIQLTQKFLTSFLHPNDPRWPRKSEDSPNLQEIYTQNRPVYPTVLSSRSQDGRRRNGDSVSRTHRSAPLVSQSALFLLRKSEELSKDARGRDSRYYSDDDTKRDHNFIADSESTGTGRKDAEK